MRQKKTAIYIMTAILGLAVILCSILGMEGQQDFFFTLGGETIHVWEKENGERYVFLPSFARPENLRIHTRSLRYLDEPALGNGDSCEGLVLDKPYAMDDGSRITFLQSRNLPALYIDTASGNMDYVHEAKDNREAGRLRLYNADGTLNAAAGLESIKGRGNTYEYVDKKPYNLTLSAEADLLGMGAAENWILLTNTFDPTHMKNKLAYDFAAEAGLPYSPDSRWVDVYLNGEYAGLYLLTEKNEVHPRRVVLTGGGFLVSKEQLYNLTDSPYFETDAGAYLRVRYNSLRESDMKAIFQRAEDAILAENGVNPTTGEHWSELIDLDSWAGKYLVEEIFDGIDAGIASQYFFYDGEKLYAGPVWDYDDTMGAGIWLGDYMDHLEQIPEIFYAHRAYETPWFHSLYYQDDFYQQITRLYKEKFSTLLKQTVEEKIPEYQALLENAARMNGVRWKQRDMGEAAEYLQWYLRARMEFLNKVWIQKELHFEVHVDNTYEEFECKYAIFDYVLTPGQCLPTLPLLEGYTWYITGTDTPFDNDQPIYEEMGIELRRDA